MILYDHPASGNCMKARILLRQLELPFERVTVDLFRGETRTDEHFTRNPDWHLENGVSVLAARDVEEEIEARFNERG